MMVHKDYKPSETEQYMNSLHLEYFKQRLLQWKQELQEEINRASALLRESNSNSGLDLADCASEALYIGLELRTQERCKKLILKIDEALERIKRKAFGYCVITNKPIGLKRLEARPIALFCIDAQEEHEAFEKNHNDDF